MLTAKEERYQTRNGHLGTTFHPAGSMCWASRPEPETLHLRFDDGDVMLLPVPWHAEGLEDPWPYCEEDTSFVLMLEEAARHPQT